jgi:hypothetical protein
MTDGDYGLRFDAKHRVLLITFGKRVTDDIYMNAYDDVKRFVVARGPYSLIVDFSLVEDFGLSNKFVREIADMTPASPAGMARIVVAPQPAAYGVSRIVETLRSETVAAIKVVRTLAEAYAGFGASASDFVPVSSI